MQCLNWKFPHNIDGSNKCNEQSLPGWERVTFINTSKLPKTTDILVIKAKIVVLTSWHVLMSLKH